MNDILTNDGAIWTMVTVFISYDGNYYKMNALAINWLSPGDDNSLLAIFINIYMKPVFKV